MTVHLDALVLPAFDDLPGLPGELGPWEAAYDLDRTLDVPGTAHPLRHDDEGLGVVPTGVGKSAAATTTSALLAWDGLSLADALVCTVGVAGGPPDRVPVGSVVLADVVVDWDLKCRFDPAADRPEITENPYACGADRLALDPELVSWAQAVADGVDLTAPADDEIPEFARGEPRLAVGTNLCGDELWHGRGLAELASRLVDGHGDGPYLATEMEDAGTAYALERFGRLADYVSVRGISNPDRPAPGVDSRASFEGSAFESGFPVAVENAVRVGRALVDRWVGDGGP